MSQHPVDKDPNKMPPNEEALRMAWETARQKAIDAWQNVTWEQAQTYIRKAYYTEENPRNNTTFDHELHNEILGENDSYMKALENVFEEQSRIVKHTLENWQETKHRMQGSIEMRIGKDSEVDWQKLSNLKLSDAIAQDSITHNVERNAEKNLEPER